MIKKNNKLSAFGVRVYTVTKKIPRGKVATYKAVARAIGSPRAYRAVGNALNKNPYAPKVPCHRVVCADGRLGGFAGGSDKKIRLLKGEGVLVKSGRVSLQKFGFNF
jgi:methylated-DNA-[protein]-cysteine S-methyltransferase